jgi:hypothetical protein
MGSEPDGLRSRLPGLPKASIAAVDAGAPELYRCRAADDATTPSLP